MAEETQVQQRQPESTELTVPQTMHIDAPPPVQKTEDGETIGTQDNPRNQRMSEILRHREEVRLTEPGWAEALADGVSPADPAEQTTDGASEAQPTAAPIVAQPATDAKPIEPVAPVNVETKPPLRVLKVNGSERQLTDDELIKAAQLGLAAEDRFQQAARLRDEAIALRNQALQTHSVVQPTVPAQPVAQAPATQPLLDAAKARDLAKRLAYGTEEDQASALQDLAQSAVQSFVGRQQPQPTPDQIANYAAQVALLHDRHERNVEAVGNEFKEVFEDQDLTNVAIQRSQALHRHYATVGESKSELEIYREALGYVRDKFLKSSEAQPQQETQNPTVQAAPAQERLERKRAAPKPLAAANVRATLNDPTPQVPTGSQIVAQMRKSRGQQLYN